MLNLQRPSVERILYKDYYPKGSGAKQKKIPGHEREEARRQDKLVDGKPPVVK
jgi:hypothetical protein